MQNPFSTFAVMALYNFLLLLRYFVCFPISSKPCSVIPLLNLARWIMCCFLSYFQYDLWVSIFPCPFSSLYTFEISTVKMQKRINYQFYINIFIWGEGIIRITFVVLVVKLKKKYHLSINFSFKILCAKSKMHMNKTKQNHAIHTLLSII